MTPDELHALIERSEPPFTIETRGGRSYHITDKVNVWNPESYKDMLGVVIPGKGIVVLRVNAIESVHIEHDAVGTR